MKLLSLFLCSSLPLTFLVLKSILSDINTSISCSLKVHVMPLHFYERSTLVPVFSNWMKSEEDFHFYEKGQKSKYRSLFILQQVIIEAACTSSFLGPTLSVSASGPQSLQLCLQASVLHVDFFCVSISKICPKVSEKSKRALSDFNVKLDMCFDCGEQNKDIMFMLNLPESYHLYYLYPEREKLQSSWSYCWFC